MKEVNHISGTVAILDRNNVDTDAIIPKQFMKSIGRTGFGPYAFDAWRYLDEGHWGQDCSTRPLNPEFELNQSRYVGSTILISGKNFGCGSSREHAPWALSDYGFEAILAESFADIFRGNCLKNGLLVIELPSDTISTIREYVSSHPGSRGDINLRSQSICIDELRFQFNIDSSWKERLLNGQDDISLTLQETESIKNFESAQRTSQPWLYRQS